MRKILLVVALGALALGSACNAQPQGGQFGRQDWRAGPWLGPMMAYGYCPGAAIGNGAHRQGWYGGGMMGGRGGMMSGGMAYGFEPQQTAAWLDAAKRELGIGSAQEAAWSAYADAVQADHASMLAMHAQMPAMMSAASAAPDRLQAHLNFMQARLASLQLVETASRTLFQVLTPNQRARANQTLWSGCW